MKNVLLSLLALVLICPALAEEPALQTEANAAYTAVLLEDAAYTSMQPESEHVLQDRKPVRFAVLDMDGDGVHEVILEEAEPEGYIILTYRNGVVHAGEMPWRGLMNLKDDGTYCYASGAADNGVAHMGFVRSTEDEAPLMIVSHMEACVFQGDDGSVQYSVICTGETDEAAWLACVEKQDAKLDAIWYDYTEENVRLLLAR